MTAPAQDEVVARLLDRLKADGGRYLLSIALTSEERDAEPVPTYGGRAFKRWLTEEELGTLVAALTALAHRADVARVLEPIESAPRTGRHILVYDLTPNSDGFGIFDGVRQPFAAVAHYWSHPGEEGFYLSSGSVDEPLMRITHWKEI